VGQRGQDLSGDNLEADLNINYAIKHNTRGVKRFHWKETFNLFTIIIFQKVSTMESTTKHPSVYKGVIDGSEQEYNVENVKHK
jgi:hypothetical protein